MLVGWFPLFIECFTCYILDFPAVIECSTCYRQLSPAVIECFTCNRLVSSAVTECLCLLYVGWSPVVGLASVECAEKINQDICRKYGVRGYPTFKVLYGS